MGKKRKVKSKKKPGTGRSYGGGTKGSRPPKSSRKSGRTSTSTTKKKRGR